MEILLFIAFLLQINIVKTELNKQERYSYFKTICGKNTYRNRDFDPPKYLSQVSSLTTCTRKCAENDNCYGFNVCKNEGKYTCEIFNSNITFNDKCYWLEYKDGCNYMEMTVCEDFDKCGEKQQKSDPIIEDFGNVWKNQVEHDQSGNIISGNKADLISALELGNDLRVIIQSWINDSTLIVNGQIYAWTGSNEACVQSLLNGLTEGTSSNMKVYRRFLSVCTTGFVQLQEFELGKPGKVKEVLSQHSMIWFSKFKSELVHACDSSGQTIDGSIQDLMAHSELGYEFIVRLSSLKYNMKITSFEIYDDEKISYQAIWQMSRPNYYSLKSNPYWYVPLMTQTGFSHFLRWYVESNFKYSSNQQLPLEWFVNKEWNLVFSNDKDGRTIKGDKAVLLFAIEKGHRVRVRVQNRTEEATSIRIRKGEIWAETLESCLQQDKSYFNTNVTRVYRFISTTGKLNIFYNHVLYRTTSFGGSFKESADWYVDLVPWSEILTTNSYPSSLSVINLASRIQDGKTVRLRLDHEDIATYLSTETVESLANSEILATATLNIEPIYDADLGFVLAGNSSWNFVFISTNGKVILGEHGEILNYRIVWYSSG